MSVWVPLVIGASLVLAWVGWRVMRTGAAFLAELRLQRSEGEVRSQGGSLADAESAVFAAQDGLRSVLRQSWWELAGFGDPALRQRELVHACGELARAQRTMDAVRRRSPFLALDPGEVVGFVEDPVRALAIRGSWIGWFALMLAPRPIRRLYTFVALRRAVLPLLDVAIELGDRMAVVRSSVGSRPVPSLQERLAAA